MRHIETLLRAREALRAPVSACLARSRSDRVIACALSCVSWRALEGAWRRGFRHECFSTLSRSLFGGLLNAYVTLLALLSECLDRHPAVIGLADNRALSPKGHTRTRTHTYIFTQRNCQHA